MMIERDAHTAIADVEQQLERIEQVMVGESIRVITEKHGYFALLEDGDATQANASQAALGASLRSIDPDP